MIRIEVSYYDESSGNDAWIDITTYLNNQFTNNLPSDFQQKNHGVFPDDIATDDEAGHWYDLRLCILDALADAEEQLEIAKNNSSSSTAGANNVEIAEKKVSSLKHFFDGRLHAMRITDTEGLGSDEGGTNIRVLMEYRYTSRNA